MHRFKVALTGNRKARLDHVNTHIFEHFGELNFFIVGHGGTGRLLAVAHGGVKNADSLGHDSI